MDSGFIGRTLPSMRVYVMGATGSGKSTLAQGLSRASGGALPVLHSSPLVIEYMRGDKSLKDSPLWPCLLDHDATRIRNRLSNEADLKVELMRQTEAGEYWPAVVVQALFHDLMNKQSNGWVLECSRRIRSEYESLFGQLKQYPADAAISLEGPTELIIDRAMARGKHKDQADSVRWAIDEYLGEAEALLLSLSSQGMLIRINISNSPEEVLRQAVDGLARVSAG